MFITHLSCQHCLSQPSADFCPYCNYPGICSLCLIVPSSTFGDKSPTNQSFHLFVDGNYAKLNQTIGNCDMNLRLSKRLHLLGRNPFYLHIPGHLCSILLEQLVQVMHPRRIPINWRSAIKCGKLLRWQLLLFWFYGLRVGSCELSRSSTRVNVFTQVKISS
jgi:hypothetical protein